MNPFLHINDFLEDHASLFNQILAETHWDERMKARKTASFGIPYNYSQIQYAFQPFPDNLEIVRRKMKSVIGFEPNNCLMNFYPDGGSSMGFHSDTATGRQKGTGVAIISLGAQRNMVLQQKSNRDIETVIQLNPGSLIYLDDETQKNWLHAIPKADNAAARISLSFRAIDESDQAFDHDLPNP